MPMFFDRITVPQGTPETDPMEQQINVRSGDLIYVALYFPANTQFEVGVRLSDEWRSFGPMGGWVTGEDEKIDWPEQYSLQGPPYRLSFFAYNESATTDYDVGVLVVFA